jgi:hypothetical protein
MSIDASVQTIYDGVVNATLQLVGVCDGTGLDETNVTKVDVSSLVPTGGRIRIDEVQYDVAFGQVKLSWEDSPNRSFIALNGFGSFDYRRSGGLQNAGSPNATGNILLTTVGFDLNSSYTIVLKMRKKG